MRVQLALDGEAAELMLGELATIHCKVVLLDRHGCLSAVSGSADPTRTVIDSAPFFQVLP